jgi:hypothetical protein
MRRPYYNPENHDGVFRLVLEAEGIDIDACDNEGRTPLFYVNSCYDAALLLNAGANKYVYDYTGHTPADVIHARGTGFHDVAQLIDQWHLLSHAGTALLSDEQKQNL